MKWSTYNQSLVIRGKITIGFDVIDNWDDELKEMNKGIVERFISFGERRNNTIVIEQSNRTNAIVWCKRYIPTDSSQQR